MARTYTPKQTPRAIAMRRRKAAKEVGMATGDISVEGDRPGGSDIPLVEVVSPAEKPQPSLKERLMGRVAQPSPDKRKRSKKVDENLMRQLAPTLVATFVATYSRQIIPDPYKPCAPSQEEVVSMVAPYFNILSRYIEITGQASQNTLDLINAVLSSIMYGVRAYITYVQIKEAEKNHESLTELHARQSREYRQNLEREAAQINAYADSEEIDRYSGYSASQDSIAGNDSISSQNGNNEDVRRDADKVAELLQREFAGRRQLGLV